MIPDWKHKNSLPQRQQICLYLEQQFSSPYAYVKTFAQLNQWGEKEQKLNTSIQHRTAMSFFECAQASLLFGLRIRLRLLTEEFACMELISGFDYTIHNGQGRVSIAELSLSGSPHSRIPYLSCPQSPLHHNQHNHIWTEYQT